YGDRSGRGVRRRLIARKDERAVQAAGTGAERLDAAQHLLPAGPAHRRRGAPPGPRTAPPHARAPLSGEYARQLAIAQPRRSLDGEALDGVEVAVEDAADRAVGAG